MPTTVVVPSDPRSSSDETFGWVVDTVAPAVPGSGGLPRLRDLVAAGPIALVL
jgi:hypothetical protein